VMGGVLGQVDARAGGGLGDVEAMRAHAGPTASAAQAPSVRTSIAPSSA